MNCPFYFKIGACRHGDRCSRQHHRPPFSQTVLVKHMWVNPQSQIAAAGGDPATIDESKSQDEFNDFYEEVCVVDCLRASCACRRLVLLLTRASRYPDLRRICQVWASRGAECVRKSG